MTLPPRIPKKPKRETRWRSQAHLNFIRSFACAMCGSTVKVEAAHVRLGSGAGLGQKPHDYYAVPLCGNKCHREQHNWGERTFWDAYAVCHRQTVEQLIEAFCAASPKASEIRRVRQEREAA